MNENEQEGSSARLTPGGTSPTGEQWYELPVSSVYGPQLHHEVDYSEMPELLTYLKPGDIVYEGNGQFLGDLFGHIAMVIGIAYDYQYQQPFVLMIEAYLDGVGYSVMTPERFQEKDVVIIRLNDATESQIQGAINWTRFRLDCTWDISEIISGKEFNGQKEKWYCSEFIWAAYYSQGIYIDKDDNLPNGGSIVFPDEILEYSNAVTVLHYEFAPSREIYNDVYHSYTYGEDVYFEEHQHVYTAIDESSHSISCYCGYEIMENHDYEPHNFCYEKCTICGYENQIVEHDYTHNYISINSSTHYGYCECGDRKVFSHDFYISGLYQICSKCNHEASINHTHVYTYTPLLGSRHTKSCGCGDYVVETCIGTASVGGNSRCMLCGQDLTFFPGILSIDEEPALLNNKEDEEY